MINTINNRLAKTGGRLTKRGERFIYGLIIAFVLLASFMFGVVTHDVCYVGTEYGNFLGYGSCEQMIDRVVGGGK